MTKPVLMDGSCGSLLWAFADEYGIKKDPTWRYNIEHPELVEKMVQGYIEAGSSMVQTNTFSVNRLSVASSPYSVEALVRAAVQITKGSAHGFDVKPYLSVGPLPVLLKPYGMLSSDECKEMYAEIFSAATAEGIEAIALETFMDIEMMKIAVSEAIKCDVPVYCSMTFGKRHRTMMGNSVSQIVDTLSPMAIQALGMNCSMGPVDGLEVIKEYRQHTDLPLYFKPNAGVGDAYDFHQFAEEVTPALDFVDYVGGCCGTNFDYIKELKRRIDARG